MIKKVQKPGISSAFEDIGEYYYYCISAEYYCASLWYKKNQNNILELVIGLKSMKIQLNIIRNVA